MNSATQGIPIFKPRNPVKREYTWYISAKTIRLYEESMRDDDINFFLGTGPWIELVINGLIEEEVTNYITSVVKKWKNIENGYILDIIANDENFGFSATFRDKLSWSFPEDLTEAFWKQLFSEWTENIKNAKPSSDVKMINGRPVIPMNRIPETIVASIKQKIERVMEARARGEMRAKATI